MAASGPGCVKTNFWRPRRYRAGLPSEPGRGFCQGEERSVAPVGPRRQGARPVTRAQRPRRRGGPSPKARQAGEIPAPGFRQMSAAWLKCFGCFGGGERGARACILYATRRLRHRPLLWPYDSECFTWTWSASITHIELDTGLQGNHVKDSVSYEPERSPYATQCLTRRRICAISNLMFDTETTEVPRNYG